MVSQLGVDLFLCVFGNLKGDKGHEAGVFGVGWPHIPIQRFPLGFPGGADKNVIVFDKSSEQILATLKGHTKKVTSVVFHPSQVRLALSSLPGCLKSGYQHPPLLESPAGSS